MNSISFGRIGMSGYQTPYTSGRASKMSLRDRYYFGHAGIYSDRPVHVYPDALYTTGGGANKQELHLNYDASSTEDNPVIKAWGIDSNGNDYEELIYVNEVNPRNATVAEMKALEAHLKEKGDSVLTARIPRMGGGNFIGEALGGFDVHEKIDFIQLFNEVADKAMELDEAAGTRLDADRFLYLWMSKEKELLEEVMNTSGVNNASAASDIEEKNICASD